MAHKAVQLLQNAVEAGRELGSVLEEARELYESFHWGNEPTELEGAECPHVEEGDVLVVLGELERVDYRTTKGDTDAVWFHHLEHERPKLCMTLEGRLVIVGGDYRVTERGIVG